MCLTSNAARADEETANEIDPTLDPSDAIRSAFGLPGSSEPSEPLVDPSGNEVGGNQPAGADGPLPPDGNADRYLSTRPEVPEVTLPAAPVGYELIRRLGGGGMGDVFLARDLSADRLAAMKFLRACHSTTGNERFVGEVRALAKIDNPRIVRVFAHDFYRLQPYFTMEYVEGGTLTERVRAVGPLPPTEAAELVLSVAEAMSAAHTAGVVHRDLKPSNILLTRHGTPKVSDFGLAKRTDQPGESLTQTGPLGTPAFMPPEQVSPRRRGVAGARADVYGLGATLYYTLTGRPPFEGEPMEVLISVERDVPERVRSIRPEVPPELEAIVCKCLEKDQDDRYQSMDELAAELRRFLAGEQPLARQQTRGRRLRHWLIGRRFWFALVGVFSLLLALAVTLMRPAVVPDPQEVMRSKLQRGEKYVLADELGRVRHHKWWLTPSSLAATPTTNNINSFQTSQPALLELCSDPGVMRYRVSAELLHAHSELHNGQASKTMGSVGLYIGHAPREFEDGTRVDPVLIIQFTDLQRTDHQNNAVRSNVEVVGTTWVQDPNGEWPRTGGAWASPGLEFKPPRTTPGLWRRVTFEVAPDLVVAKWQDTPGGPEQTISTMTAEDIYGAYQRMSRKAQEMSPAIGPFQQTWNPRLGFGLVGYKSQLLFKNVTIEPLP